MYMFFVLSFIVSVAAFYFAFKDRVVAAFGAALYTFMPYRIYVCFCLKDKGQAAFWMLLPLVMMCLIKMYEDSKIRTRLLWMIPAVVSLAVLSRADATLTVVGCFVLILVGLMMKRFLYVPTALCSVLGSVAVNINYWRFILLGHQNNYSVEPVLIAGKGYYFGKYFMGWKNFDGLPGLGFGLLFSIALILIYLLDIKKNPESADIKVEASQAEASKAETSRDVRKTVGILTLAAVILAAMAFHWGIWDIAQRVHPILLRFISSLSSPNVLFGFACTVLCIPSVLVIKLYWNEKKAVTAKFVPMLIVGINVFAAVFQIAGSGL